MPLAGNGGGHPCNGGGSVCVVKGMDLEKPAAHEPCQTRPAEQGCVFAVVRIPVRIVAVLIVLPVRVVWDLLVLAARATHRHLLRPAGHAVARVCGGLYGYVLAPVGRGLAWLVLAVCYWPWAALWRYVLAPAGAALWRWLLVPLARALVWPWVAVWRYVLVPGAAALYRYLLRPAGKGIERVVLALVRYLLLPACAGLTWLVRGIGVVLGQLAKALLYWPWVALWRYVVVPVAAGVHRYLLTPLGHGIAWAARATYRYLLTPLGHFLAAVWHLAGRVSRALGRGLLWLWKGLVARPAAWVGRRVLTPAGHVVREVWRGARAAVREARASVRQALFGTPPREPARSRARTLGSTTAAGNAPAPEISLHKRQG